MSSQSSAIKTKEQLPYVNLYDIDDLSQNSFSMLCSNDSQVKDIIIFLQNKFGKDDEFEITDGKQKLDLNHPILSKYGNNFKCYYKKKKIHKQNITIKEEQYKKDNDNQRFPNNNNTILYTNKQEHPQTVIENNKVNVNLQQCQNCDQRFQQLEQKYDKIFNQFYDQQKYFEQYILYLSEQLEQHKYFQQKQQKISQTDSLIEIIVNIQIACCQEKIEKEQFEKIVQYSIEKNKTLKCPNFQCRKKIPFISIRKLGQLGDQYILMALQRELTYIYNKYSTKTQQQQYNIIKCENQNCAFFCIWDARHKLIGKNDYYYCPSCLGYTLKEPRIKFLGNK